MIMHEGSQQGPRRFHSTAWSIIRAAGDSDPDERERGWERLVRVYWRPTYWHLRRSWNLDPDDARDALQSFFSMVLEQDLLGGVAPERGRFRSFLKVTLKNFMLDLHRYDRAQRRGGDRTPVPWDELMDIEKQPPSTDLDPGEVFDRELLASVISAALIEVRDRARAEGRARDEEIFRRFYLAEAEGTPVSYRELADEFGASFHEVKNRLFEMRLRFRRIVLDIMRDGTSNEEEIISEVREVFGR